MENKTENLIEDGFIIIARKSLGSNLWEKPSDYLKIWIYILMKVNHKDNFNFKRGENYFNWTDDLKNLKGIKKNTLYHCLKWLKFAKQIATQKTTRGMVLKVNNYEFYQDIKNYKMRNEMRNEMRNRCETDAKQMPNDKQERKKLITKEVNSNMCYFENFWNEYPVKKGKDATEKKFYSLLKKDINLFPVIMQGLKAYKQDIENKKTESKYIKHPSTWLNQGCWNDEYSAKNLNYKERVEGCF